jgi:hypothetical protein
MRWPPMFRGGVRAECVPFGRRADNSPQIEDGPRGYGILSGGGFPCWNKKNPLLRVLAFWKGDDTTGGIDC